LKKRPTFERSYINAELNKLSATVTSPTTVFIIGGLALISYELKDATKDIDVVVMNAADFELLINSLRSIGYAEPQGPLISRPYQDMEVAKIMENKDGFRWDIFLGKICNKLSFSDSMASRTTNFFSKANLVLCIASKEDIFLFKGITTREADLEDMRLLTESDLDWQTIKTECRHQSEISGRLWEDALVQNLKELRERYGINSPIEGQLRKLCEEKMGENAIISSARSGHNTIKSISQDKKLPEFLVREYVGKAEKKGLIKIDKTSRPYLLSLGASNR
jgi:hypothetical protein